MPVFSIAYRSSIIKKPVSSRETTDKTSFQILLSRSIAEPNPISIAEPRPAPPAMVASIFENQSSQIMTIGYATPSASHTIVSGACVDTQEEPSESTGGPSAVNTDVIDDANQEHPDHLRVDPTPTVSGARTSPIITTRSIQSTPDVESSLSPIECESVKIIEAEKQGGSERGRTLARSPRVSNPFSQAESRIRRNDLAIEIDARDLGKRARRSSTLHDNPTDLPAILDDHLLEPCPHDPLCDTVSDVLNTPISPVDISRSISRINSATLELHLRLASFPGPTPSLGMISSESEALSMIERRSSSAMFVEIDKGQLALGLPSKLLHCSQEFGTGSKPSLAAYLPTEILHQIYNNLNPEDFHAARHTCRIWFINSLERSLLETMFRRSGYSSSIAHDMADNYVLDSEIKVNDEWLMSKRLARECALSPAWKGNGLSSSKHMPGKSSTEAFIEISSIDFTEVAVHHQGTSSVGTIFTVSNCGKFLMAANGCLVYIYELNRSSKVADSHYISQPGSLRPVTGIICPHKVLACSMDTSSRRYAIAILLEGRMGLVCDISTLNKSFSSPQVPQDHAFNPQPPEPSSSRSRNSSWQGLRATSFLDRVSLNSSASNLGLGGAPPTEPTFVFPGIATSGSSFAPANDSAWQDVFHGDVPSATQTEGPSSRHSSLPKTGILRADSRLQSILPPYPSNDSADVTMPIETGPRSLYRNLCSDDDPPRAVAICPQRRCVAFGCSAGIELHWVDALTGQDLNRWFPLTAPSDYLFFLPPRRTVDSAKKLRLISSAARPSERPAIVERAFGHRTRSSPFWDRLGRTTSAIESGESSRRVQALGMRGGDSSTRFGNAVAESSDHYRAVPLSDGYHILFTDPVTGFLCLGSDAPVGGPTKLLRKMWFQGPAEDKGSPIAYASGSDLQWGVRIVAAFGPENEQSVWLFSVPSDMFTAEQNRSATLWPCDESSKDAQNWEWLDWWPEHGEQEWLTESEDPTPSVHPRSTWPVKIRGQQIGTCKGVIDLAIDSGPDMVIWALSKTGIAKVWKLNVGRNEEPQMSLVVRDGTIRDMDGMGDIKMSGLLIPSPAISAEPESALQQESFDGAFSPPAPDFSQSRMDRGELDDDCVRYDFEGDVLMDDLCLLDPADIQELEDPQVSFEGMRGQVWYGSFWEATSGWRGKPHSLGHADLVEELTGIARIDFEIR
ncbi:hypothetical protein HYALB_00008918 [Hymenoscyphus albidus]|uniref:F-box domain-containing protein n=1 Tax=Hymenoscyphus albidus TaxID=595503 RepID=A0A9N9QAA7_9HELO|nr:hypothetical protein HYALB_00008918 [Hymenoscyphus albidus]